MTGLQWLKLDNAKLNQVPEELGNLMKLVSPIIPSQMLILCTDSYGNVINNSMMST